MSWITKILLNNITREALAIKLEMKRVGISNGDMLGFFSILFGFVIVFFALAGTLTFLTIEYIYK